MKWSSFIWVLFTTVLSGAEYNSITVPCDSTLPAWAYNTQSGCNTKTLQYSKNGAISPWLGGQTSLNYNLKQNDSIEMASMGAQYTNDSFLAKIQSSYVKDKFDHTASAAKTNLSMQYRKKLWDSLVLSASENVFIPFKIANEQTDLTKYTSVLKAIYPVNDSYNIVAEGSYSLLETPTSENCAYRNPYSYTTGITYSDGTDTAINASYILIQEADPTLHPEKKIKLARKHKINKKIKTSLSVIKHIETKQPDDQATFNMMYAF